MVRHKKWKMCSRRATQNIESYALNGHSPRFESASTVYVWGYHMLEAKLIYIKMEAMHCSVRKFEGSWWGPGHRASPHSSSSLLQ